MGSPPISPPLFAHDGDEEDESPEHIARRFEDRARAANSSAVDRYNANNDPQLSRLPLDRPTPIFAVKTKVKYLFLNKCGI